MSNLIGIDGICTKVDNEVGQRRHGDRGIRKERLFCPGNGRAARRTSVASWVYSKPSCQTTENQPAARIQYRNGVHQSDIGRSPQLLKSMRHGSRLVLLWPDS